MKTGTVMSLSAAILMVVGCAHHQVRPLPGPQGIETSVLPVYVHATGREVEKEFNRKKTVTSRYYACAGVYVRPNVLVTSINVFPGALDDSSVQYLGDIFVGPDGETRTVKAFHTHELVALIVTEETGLPLPLRRGQAAQGEKLTKFGIRFTGAPRASAHTVAELTASPAVIVDSPFSAFGDENLPSIYSAKMDVKTGQCGAPLLDDSGQLVGIVNLTSEAKQEASVINAAMIGDALKEFGLER